ncbi:MAG: sulfatase-like hydrolase/transferase [Verrucomicrobiota bacterium]
MLQKPNFLLTLLFAAISASSAQVAAKENTERPNILYIYTDDQSDRTVSCYERSAPWVKTPNIDRLAAQGVRFRNAYNGTWCMPARATFLTGKLQYGIESMRMEGPYPGSEYDAEKSPFWMRSFKEAGYTTAQIGKWHTGTDTGYGRDWDYQIVWNRPKFPSNSGSYYYDQLITFNGGETIKIDGYSTDNYTKWATEYIRGKGRQEDKPWLLWLCYAGTHGPFTPADRHYDAIPQDAPITLPKDMFGPRPGKPQYVKDRQAWNYDDKGELRTKRPGKQWEFYEASRRYQETALSLDEAVGALMQALKDTEQLENTLVIFTSDQGFAWGHHGFQHKMAPYDANISCPLIVAFPGKIPKGEVCSTPVGGQDLVPTLFSFAGVELPWKVHGRDMTPLLENPSAESNHPVLIAYTGRKYGSDTQQIQSISESPSGINWWISYRKGQYKYIMNLIEGEVEELYDLLNDDEELINLAYYPEYRGTLVRYRKDAIAELERTDCPFIENLPIR